MKRSLHNQLTAILFFILPTAALAQHQKPELPYNSSLVLQQPEAGAGKPSFKPSAKVRGMRALNNGTVYLVSTDNKSLSSYQGNRLMWRTNVVEACANVVGPRAIQEVTLSANTLFVSVGSHTFAEVNATTGKIQVADVQKP